MHVRCITEVLLKLNAAVFPIGSCEWIFWNRPLVSSFEWRFNWPWSPWWCLVSEEQVPKVPQRTSSQSYRLSSATAAMDSSHDPDGTLSNRKVSTDTASGADVSQMMPVGQAMLKWSVLFDDVKCSMLSFEAFFYSVSLLSEYVHVMAHCAFECFCCCSSSFQSYHPINISCCKQFSL